MNNFETRSNAVSVDTKPLFASTWIALYTVLRKNYTERQLAAQVNTDDFESIKKESPAHRLNSN